MVLQLWYNKAIYDYIAKAGDYVKRPEKKFEKYWYAGLTGFCVIVAAVVVYLIFSNISGVGSVLSAINTALFPVYIGIVVAYLLAPLVDKIEHFLFVPLFQKVYKGKKNKAQNHARGFSVFVVLILALLVVFGLLMLVIPELVNSISGFASNLPGYYDNMIKWGNKMFQSYPKLAELYAQFSSTIYENLLAWLQNDLLPNSNKLLSTVTDGLVNAASVLLDLFIGLIISIYLLAGKENFCAQAKKIMYAIFPAKSVNHLLDILGETHTIFAKFISGKIIDSLIIGIITFILLNIAGIPYTVLISVLIGVTNIIPFFGPYIGTIPSAILVFIAAPSKGILFLVLIIILMQVDGNIVSPKILGDSIGLESFWILFSILFFGSLFGVLGMICAVPVFAILYRIAKRWCATRLAKKEMPTETAYYRRENESLKKTDEIK